MKIIDTLEAYNDAIKTIKSGVDFDFDDGRVSLDNGWKARVEVIAHTRNKQHFLYISNNRFGFLEAKMSVAQWKKIEAAYLSTYVKSHNTYDTTYKNVKALLSLLLIYCAPKNCSDYPKIIQDEWIHLGFSFGHDLFDLIQKTVNESEWVDWAPHWRNKYFRLLRSMEKDGRKVPELGEEGQDTDGQ